MADDGKVNVRGEIEVDGEAYRLLVCWIHEAISEVPSAVCELTVLGSAESAGPPDPTAFIDKKAKIRLFKVDDSQERFFHGVIVEAERFADADGRSFVRARVCPKLWKLGKRADCRTFQEKSTTDILKAVLDGGGVSDQESKTKESYSPRVYCVQYRETDLDFVQRLASEEGIYYVVEHDDSVDKVVFADDPAGLGDVPGEASIPFRTTAGYSGGKDHVNFVKRTHRVKTDKVFVRDYDFERPQFKLEAQVEGKDDGEHALEVYEYPGRFVDQGVGKRYAQVLLDSIQAERDVVSGEASPLTLKPGYKFSITDHPYDPLNKELLITALETEWREGNTSRGVGGRGGQDFSCRFTAVPTEKTQYRPPRRVRAVAVPGTQTAMTTGPSGQEIHSDKHGRVKAKFMWDRLGKDDDTSSLWMRTSQLPTGGSMLLPRMKWEVGVRYCEGDPDTPIVMNRLYNTVTPPPYALPAGKARGAMQTATTPGGGSSNEFRMDDTKGKEEMMFNASKDMAVDVNNNCTESIGNNETRSVGSNSSTAVTNSVSSNVGADQTVSAGGNQSVKVETFFVDDVAGDYTKSIGGNRDMKIGGDHKREVGGDSSLTVGSMCTDLVVGSVTHDTAADFSHSVSAAHVEITAGDRTFSVGGSRTEATGALKAVITFGGRGVEIGGSFTQKAAGALIYKIDADRADNAGATFTEVAAGAQILKCDNAVFEADGLLSFVMGASTITLTPASISIAGVSIKIDGATAETAALIIDN